MVIVPKRLYDFYKKSLQDKGYKVYSTFTPMGIPFYQIIEQGKK
jgi:hypothetical protein